jgi:GT2 family glycosyltransferase
VGRAVRAADVDRTIGALGCQVLVSDGEIQRTCFRFPSVAGLFLLATGLHKLAPPRWFHGGPAMRDWDRRTARDVDVVSGMFLLVRRAALDKTGPMDEAYFVYAEEADLCFRLRRAGWRCVFSPCARILHEDGGGKSTAQDPVRMHVQLQKSILVFHRKNLGRASWLAAKAIYVASSACRAAYFRALSLVVKSVAVRDRGRCAAAALRFHLFGREPRR